MKETKSPQKRIAVDLAYNYLKEQTIEFLIRPGEQINEIEVAKKVGISRVPVREALNRLMAEQLVTFDHGKGYYCRKFSETTMKNLYAVRLDLETGAVLGACRSKKNTLKKALLDEWQNIAAIQAGKSIPELIDLDEQFHLKVASLSDNAERTLYLGNVYDRIRFVRRIHIENGDRRHTFVQEHIQIAGAIAEGDAVQATRYMDAHLGVNSQELAEDIRIGMLRIYADDIK